MYMRPQTAYDHKAGCLERDITVGMARYKKEKKKKTAHAQLYTTYTQIQYITSKTKKLNTRS